MTAKRYRVIQWGTGTVGKVGVRYLVENPTFELVGAFVTSEEKHGRDVGEIAGIGPIGVKASMNEEEMLAMDADCVFFTPKTGADIEPACRYLRAGKNVVSSIALFHPTQANEKQYQMLQEACLEGGTSCYSTGIHPGFAGDLLVMTAARLSTRIDKIDFYEYVDFGESSNTNNYVEKFGFGTSPEEFLSKPSRLANLIFYFEQAMVMIADGLGKTVEEITSSVEVATATRDVVVQDVHIKVGTVAGQQQSWTGWVDGKPLISFHGVYRVAPDGMEPAWPYHDSHYYRFVLEGDPEIELILSGKNGTNSIAPYYGSAWTVGPCVNAIPAVVAAQPGVLTQYDMGAMPLAGLVRS